MLLEDRPLFLFHKSVVLRFVHFLVGLFGGLPFHALAHVFPRLLFVKLDLGLPLLLPPKQCLLGTERLPFGLAGRVDVVGGFPYRADPALPNATDRFLL